MRRYFRLFAQASLVWGVIMAICLLFLFPSGYQVVIVVVVVAAVIFGLLMVLFVIFMDTSSTIRRTVTPIFGENERVIVDVPANHLKWGIGMGGRMYLTNNRVIFRTHTFLQPSYQFEVLLIDIVGLDTSFIYGVFPTGLIIQTRKGARETFVVENRRMLIDSIKRIG